MVKSPPLGGAWGGKLLLIITIPSKRTNEVFIMFYKYYIDNNERYPEDNDIVELISTEKLSFSEFKDLVHKAFELCDGKFIDHRKVANKIEEIDDRFIISEPQAVAFIGRECGKRNDKIRGFLEIKRK